MAFEALSAICSSSMNTCRVNTAPASTTLHWTGRCSCFMISSSRVVWVFLARILTHQVKIKSASLAKTTEASIMAAPRT